MPMGVRMVHLAIRNLHQQTFTIDPSGGLHQFSPHTLQTFNVGRLQTVW
jgi:hypothetical protein